MIVADLWKQPAVIAPNNFVYKSLSNWALNVAVGCGHACRFCYVPSASTIKLGASLEPYGVTDPDAEWGDYVLVRPWHDGKFMRSLREAENTPRHTLKPDGNRSVMLCSTTDPYQVILLKDPKRRRELQEQLKNVVHNSLYHLLNHSTLNVRILTRGPLARQHFDLMGAFGKRLTFGMSLPTLDPRLAKVYEPHAPSPERRLETLRMAKAAGLHVFVAMAPTYPECTPLDLSRTMAAIAELDPITVFHEPINIRSENVARIAEHGREVGVEVNTDVFASRDAWEEYAMDQLNNVEIIADQMGLSDRLHLWPDASLGRSPRVARPWLDKWWNRISEWPK
jgi:DNA repair photolyase